MEGTEVGLVILVSADKALDTVEQGAGKGNTLLQDTRSKPSSRYTMQHRALSCTDNMHHMAFQSKHRDRSCRKEHSFLFIFKLLK